MSVTARKKKLMEKEQKRIEKDGGKVIWVKECRGCPFDHYGGGGDYCFLSKKSTTTKEDRVAAFQKCPLKNDKIIVSVKE